VVVAKYNEDVGWLDRLPPAAGRVVVYDKSPGGTYLNVGREAETFARAICDLYDDLPAHDHVAFLQGNPFDHLGGGIDKLVDALASSADRRDTTPIGQLLESDALGRPHHPTPLQVGACWAELVDEHGTHLPEDAARLSRWPFAAGAQYIVPTRTILGKPKAFWKRLHELIWTGRICPWTAERLWWLIFQ